VENELDYYITIFVIFGLGLMFLTVAIYFALKVFRDWND